MDFLNIQVSLIGQWIDSSAQERRLPHNASGLLVVPIGASDDGSYAIGWKQEGVREPN